jgi:chromate transporter
MNDENPLTVLALNISLLSLLAVGGGLTILPDVQRLSVDVYHWMTAAEFVEVFAIAQAAPGPNILYVSIVGWKAAGLPGALVATAAICGPPAVITFFVTRMWDRFRATTWRRALELGLAPVTIGIVLASGFILMRTADNTWVAYAITGATIALVMATRINPLWMMGLAALLGISGIV